jgi:hypothetical protein
MKQRVRIEPNRVLILCLGDSAEGCPGSWGFVLDENDDESTRLLLRSWAAGAAGQLGLIDRILEPGYLVTTLSVLAMVALQVLIR